jgi:hypothetical protein
MGRGNGSFGTSSGHLCHREHDLPSALHRRRDQADDRLPATSPWLRRQPAGYQWHDIMSMIGEYRLASTAVDIEALELAQGNRRYLIVCGCTGGYGGPTRGRRDRGGRRIKV